MVGVAMGLDVLPVLPAALVFVSPMDALLMLVFAAGLVLSTMTSLR